MANRPETQAEARSILASQIKDTIAAYNAAKQAGDETQSKQLWQQYKELNNKYKAAESGTAGSVGRGLLAGILGGGEFYGKGAQLAAPLLTAPARYAKAKMEGFFGKPVTEPQSQEQLIPFRAGEFAGQAVYPTGGLKSLAVPAALTAADVAAETQGAKQGLVSGGALALLMGKAGFQGLKGWREGRQFENLMKNLPEDMPDLERNALKRFMLTGQGSDNGIVAAAMQKLETNPKFAEMLGKLRQGATEQTLAGMRPEVGRLTKEESATGLIQGIKNKLEGIKEHGADSLFDKARKYGGDVGLVNPENTIGAIDKLTERYSNAATPNAEQAVKVLTSIRDRLSPSFTTAKFGPTTTTVREATPTINIPGSPARTSSYQTPVVRYDSLGMPIQETTTTNFTVPAAGGTTIAGTPAVQGIIPGGGGATINKGPQPLTVSQVQGFLSEFGRKAGAGDQLIKDLALSDEKIISSAIFGGLQDDLRSAYNGATGADKTALGFLRTARDKVAKSATAYNEAVSQGLPAFLKDKNPSTLSFDVLLPEYEKLDAKQRATVRAWLGETDPEVLKQFDRGVYTNFLDKARDSQGNVDLAKLAEAWNTTSVKDRGVLVDALGMNAGEFNARMKDATAFSNRLRVAQSQAEASAIGQVAPDVARAAGATVGYGAHQAVMLGADVAKQLLEKSKLTDEQLMKLLLTPEGASFLKEAKMTPGSVQLLDKLTKATEITKPPALTVQQTGTVLNQPEQQPVTPPQPALPEFKLVEPDVTTQQPEQQPQQPAFKMVD